MELWFNVHREVTGAWRSACYDIYRQLSQRKQTHLLTDETAEFAVRNRAGSPPRRPRRVAATGGVALLVAGGAAGTYLAVAGSLTALRTPPAVAIAAAEPTATAATREVTGNAPSLEPSAQPTAARPQPRRSTPPPVLAMPVAPPAKVPTSNSPESTPTPTASPSPSVSVGPSPSASVLSPTRTDPKTPKRGQSNVGMEGR